MRKRLFHIVLIVALGLLAYSNTFYSPFQFDDKPQIIENPVIKDLHNFTSSTKGYEYASNYYNPRRSIGYLTFALNYHFGGLNVTGYHIVNLLIHLINGILVYFFVILTFRTPYFDCEKLKVKGERAEDGRHTSGVGLALPLNDSQFTIHDSPSVDYSPFTANYSHFIALFSALLFISHPVQTQAVTYVAQRFTSLATLFYLAAVVFYVKGRLASAQADKPSSPGQASSTQGRSDWHAGRLFSRQAGMLLFSLLSAVCAMKTKEIAFTLPLVIIIYEFTFFKSSLRKKLLFLLPVLLALIIVSISVLHSDKSLGEMLSDVSERTRVQTSMPRWDYLMTQMRVIMTYLRLIVLPINQNLDYDYPAYHSLFTPSIFLSFLFLLSILGLGIYLLLRGKKNNPPSPAHYLLIGFGILWFFITLSVESSIIPIVDVIFEHRLYLPMVGVLTGITTGVLIAAKRLKIEKIVIPVLVLITLLLSGLTYARNRLWNDGISLWQDVVEKSPDKDRPHSNLANAYASQGQLDRAIVEYQTALRLNPDYAEAHNNLGVAYGSQGQLDWAIADFQTALRLEPDYAEAHNNLGVAYASQGQLDRAIAKYQQALRLNPDFAEAHNNLGIVYVTQGQLDRAIAEYQTALRLKPDYAKAYNNLGIAYASQGQLDKAIAEYQTALRLEPDFYEARQRLNDIVSIRH